MADTMRRSEWLVRVAVVFCLLYGVIGAHDRHQDAFPIFSWDLFTRVPNPRKSDYSIRLLETDGVPLKRPMYFEAAGLAKEGRAAQAYIAMQHLGAAVSRDNGMAIAILRSRFEATYLNQFAASAIRSCVANLTSKSG